MRAHLGIVWLCVTCGGDAEPVECAEDLTWERFGDAFMTSWCTSCHHPALQDQLRGGAPTFMNFDAYADVVDQAPLILSSATGDDARMPPGGGPTQAQRDRLRQWITCGLPSEAPPADTCRPGVVEGPVELSSDADVQTLCGSGSTVEGDLIVDADMVVDCLCHVEGDVRITASGTVSLPTLATVDGTLEVADNPGLVRLDAPALQSVGGLDIRSSGLARLDLPDLSDVAGDLIVDQLPLGGTLALDEVTTVGGTLQLTRLATITRVGLSRLADVGAMTVSDVGAAELLMGPLATVGGPLEICDNPALRSVSALDRVQTVQGTLALCNNAALQRLALGALETVQGDLVVEDNPQLPTSEAETLAERVQVKGEVRISGNRP